jgi:hypothetical protein
MTLLIEPQPFTMTEHIASQQQSAVAAVVIG